MTKRIRPVQTVGTVGVMALVLVLQACGSSNSPSTPGTAGTGNPAGSAGTTGAAGTTASAGTTGSAGTTAAGGTTGTGGMPGQPSCIGLLTHGPTGAGGALEPAKGVVCDMTLDINVCYRTCGPEKQGYKSETCTSAGSYQEMSGCSFDPTKDFSCYKIPATANTVCPTGITPMGSADCSTYNVPTCTLCNSTQGTAGGQYADSTGAAKTGYCVCQAPDANGARKWSCASDTAWPCPLGSGC